MGDTGPRAFDREQPAPSADDVRAQLRRILISGLFRNAARQKRFLTFTVEQSLGGKGPQLKEALVGIQVFDRQPGYDSQADNIVRVEARRLRAKLHTYYTNGGQGDPIVISYPVGSYAPLFASSMAAVAGEEVSIKQGTGTQVRRPVPRKQVWRPVLLGAAICAVAAFLVFEWSYSPPPPKVARVKIVAHRADAQAGFVADSQRLFFVERTGNQWTLAQTPIDGGPVIAIPSPFKTPTIFDISADESQLLIGGGESDHEQSLWSMPVAGGTPRHLDAIVANGAAWSPDGRRLAYTLGPRLFVANADGSASHAIASFQGDWLAAPRWSPDQKRLRLTDIDRTRATDSFWEVSADGSNPHPLLPGWKGDRTGGGIWVDGARYFVFSSRMNGAANLWAIAEGGLFHRTPRDPVQLTAGPVGLASPFAARNGKRLFAANTSETGELVRYDVAKDAVEPYLGGISASWCSFSRDGRYVAYSSYPDHSLWRSKVDGTEALQLTRPPMGIWPSSWSPDGSRIAMMASVSGSPSRTYLVPRDGGKPEQIIAGPGPQAGVDFSPDGKSIVFGIADRDSSIPDSEKAIYMYDLETRQRSEIPGSKGLWGPSWSPDGRYIQAGDLLHGNTMTIWDFQTRAWKRILGPGGKHWPRWTADSRHLVFESITDQEDAIYRVRVQNGRLEKIVDVKRFARTDVSHSLFSGLAPDGSPLMMRFRNSFDISAIDLEFH